MSRLRSWIFVSLAVITFSLDGPILGATRPTSAQRCVAAKIAAAAKKARADLACRESHGWHQRNHFDDRSEQRRHQDVRLRMHAVVWR
jgi:hypothetical protein